MRIGRFILDTDNMSIDELTVIIKELREIRSRKESAAAFETEMANLIAHANELGYDFIDKDFGNVIQTHDLVVVDNKKVE